MNTGNTVIENISNSLHTKARAAIAPPETSLLSMWRNSYPEQQQQQQQLLMNDETQNALPATDASRSSLLLGSVPQQQQQVKPQGKARQPSKKRKSTASKPRQVKRAKGVAPGACPQPNALPMKLSPASTTSKDTTKQLTNFFSPDEIDFMRQVFKTDKSESSNTTKTNTTKTTSKQTKRKSNKASRQNVNPPSAIAFPIAASGGSSLPVVGLYDGQPQHQPLSSGPMETGASMYCPIILDDNEMDIETDNQVFYLPVQKSSRLDRAFSFVQDLLALYKKVIEPKTTTATTGETKQGLGNATGIVSNEIKFDTMGTDHLVQLTERFMEQHERMIRQHGQKQLDSRRQNQVNYNDDSSIFTDTRVLIGYHATDSTNLPSICHHGLLSGNERRDKKVKSHLGFSAGAYFGQGVYLANNPHAFSTRGNACVMVAMIQGRTKHVGRIRIVDGVLTNRRASAQQQQLQQRLQQQLQEQIQKLQQQMIQNKQTSQQHLIQRQIQQMQQYTQQGSQQINGPAIIDDCEVPSYDAIIGNKTDLQGNNSYNDEIVTQSSSQCLALIQACMAPLNEINGKASSRRQGSITIGQALTADAAARDLMWTVHVELQKLLDKYFNNVDYGEDFYHVTQSGKPIVEIPKDTATYLIQQYLPVANHTVLYNVPVDQNPKQERKKKELCDYYEKTLSHSPTDKCAICNSMFCRKGRGRAVRLKVCSHGFHEHCLRAALEARPSRPCCPICQRIVDHEQTTATSPSGSMHIMHSQTQCRSKEPPTVPGLQHGNTTKNKNKAENGSIQISYSMKPGTQQYYHPNPGVAYSGAYLTAYLPNDDQGVKLLKRLKYAFSHGLTFDIGKCPISGRDNQIIWSSIKHKTSVDEYPDTNNYFATCHEELDHLQVPPADELSLSGHCVSR